MLKRWIAGPVAALALVVMIGAGPVVYSALKVEPVEDFELDRYLGTWYEIARLNHRFERNLRDVTAVYSLKENGDVKVVNKGYNTKKKKWSSAEGKAKFKGARDEGSLKVSFFGPFYAGYHIVALDEEYENALVAGDSLKYLWILSRTPEIDAEVKAEFLEKARDLGYKTDDLIWVKHEKQGS